MIANSKFAVVTTIGLSALLAVARPIHVHNAHHVHRREAEANPVEVVTVVVTNYVTAEFTADISASTSAPDMDDEPESADLDAEFTAFSSLSDHTPSIPTSEVSSTDSDASLSSSSAFSSSSFNGGAKGIVYSPYKVGGCKTADEVKSDLEKLSGFSVIRIYGVDCNQVPNVLAGLARGQKVFLGIYDMGAVESGLATINAAVGNHGWNKVHTISIGNELVNNGAASVDQIAGYLKTARGILAGYGYKGPVVSVDTFNAVIKNPGLCSLSDYVAVNAHAYFDSQISASKAGNWVAQQIQLVSAACSSAGSPKSVLISESGWPSRGNTNGAAVASLKNQQIAIASIKEKVGANCILFTAFNDYWKEDGPLNAEKYYGIFHS